MPKHVSFGALRQAAVESFVRTAILIDNEPIASAPSDDAAEMVAVASTVTYGADAAVAAPAQSAIADNENGDAASHRLWVQPVTNGFSSRRITCGFYFPANEDGGIVDTALNAARHVDATIVDWQLRPKDTGPAKELITRLIKEDRAAGGRLRLIVVYTGERGIDGECGKLLIHLQAQSIVDLQPSDEGRALTGSNVLITFANKPRATRPDDELTGPGARPVPWEKLPNFVLEQYSFLAKGLLQSFALKAIGAVREDTHHLLSIFDSSLDGAFLAQRAGIGSPDEAQEMMTSLLASEFACSILDRGIAAEVLGAQGAVHVLKPRNPAMKFTVKGYNDPKRVYDGVVVVPPAGKATLTTTSKSMKKLLKMGLDQHIVPLGGDEIIKLKQQFFENDEDARASMSAFARITSFSREAEGRRRLAKDAIYLTGGVVVRSTTGVGKKTQEKYMLCVQPGCDAVRLQADTAFPFCPLVPDEKRFDLVLCMDGIDRRLKVNRLPRDLIMQTFSPDGAQQIVTAKRRSNKKLGFKATDGTFWEFVAELRQPENQHFTTQLVGKFNRVALNGSEWLRLHAPKTG